MPRRLFNVAASLSLLLALALTAAWLLTLHSSPTFEFTHRNTPWRLTITCGRFLLDNEPVRHQEVLDRCRRIRENTRCQIAVLETACLQADCERSQLDPSDRANAAVIRLKGFEAQQRLRDLQYATRWDLLKPPPPRSSSIQHSLSFTHLLTATALLPTLRLSLFIFTLSRRRSLLKQNRCPHCSYDLRATPTRCPECGRSPFQRGMNSM
jgi:hypothetical protein